MRLEVERARLAVRGALPVVVGGRADRHARVRQVRERHQQRRALLLDLIDLRSRAAGSAAPRALFAAKIADGVHALPLRARDFVAGGVLLALESLDFRDQTAPPRFERRELLELGVRLQAAVLQAARTSSM